MGELQLEVIINDLRKRLPDLNLVVSPPIINIREACALLPALEEGKELRLPPSASIQSRFWMKVGPGVGGKAKMRVLPLPAGLCELLYRASKQSSIYQSVVNGEKPSG